MKKLILLAVTSFVVACGVAQTNWKIDASHSKVGFKVKHMMLSDVAGYFKVYEGKVTSTKDDFNDSQIEFSVDVSSINTEDAGRDTHLKAPDFFDAEKNPKMTFKSKSFKKVDGKKYKVIGDLTIRGTTKEVALDAEYLGTVVNPFTKATTAGFKVMGAINRTDFGLKWNYAIEAGGVMVGETVNIDSVVEMTKQ